MRKKITAWTIALVTAVLLLSLLPILIPSPGSTAEAVVAPTLLWGPYLSGTTANGTTINIRTDLAVTTTVEYATDAYYLANNAYDMSATDGVSAEMHHIALTGLEANTVYHYRVTYGAETTGDFHFSTFPDSGPFTFVVYSDSQDQLPLFSQAERHKLVADAIANESDIAFVLHNGDLVNNGSNLSDWNRYFDAARAMMANTTVYPALGNHEDDSPLYFDAFGVPSYYSFDCGGGHFAVLDSTKLGTVDAQAAWLESDLGSGKPWKFVSFHHPAYTSDASHFGGWENLREAWDGLFLSHGVDGIWNGHMHVYERYIENGLTYTVIGTGGAPSYALSEDKYTGYQNSLEHSLAYIKVTADPASCAAIAQVIRVADLTSNNSQVVTVYPAGIVYDSFTLAQRLTIAASAGANGNISPSGDIAVNCGDSQTINITPNAHYHIADVLVDGVSVGAVTSYTFDNIAADHTISAAFAVNTIAPDWDLNGDLVCNIGDVVIIGLSWNQAGTPGWIPEDVNKDGVINIGDIVVLGLHWGETW